MKIVINGGTGLIGSKTVARLRDSGHDVVAASPQGGVNSVTGEGVTEAVKGAQVVVDLSNSPSFEDAAVLDFFRRSTVNLIAAAKASGAKHYIALSVVGTERLQASGYFRAKMVQEELIRNSGLAYTIVHATQFFEFLGAIANSSKADEKVVVPAALIQPIASDDVAEVMAEVALQPPRNGILEIAGPERFRMRDLIARYLTATGDSRIVEASTEVPYFGAKLEEGTLVSNGTPRLGKIDFLQWFGSRAKAA
ncbi:SDR family oxidoreductase [Microvirga lotononidis]|uniref:Putative nucleoside-diphosphate sugar epimerase n=1 Tax=Microvirga lotononidis TaxID=864069 RepID=I4YR85_9HYPH|nr:SDR family oxidoreductase [Microvirga lotononidis]EIM26477.1 putative nucleoside-diphosphate sugar epimerase [Microvirga lotononidis]WQO31167.1 SDR family oxidoreductase [Microvirga lotononidis]